MSEGINCTPARIIQWFTDSEKCLMHSNTTPIEIIQINLSENQLDALIEQGKKMIKETELKYTVNTLVHLSRELWGNNSTEFLAGALRSVITDKQMVVLIDDLERQVKEISK